MSNISDVTIEPHPGATLFPPRKGIRFASETALTAAFFATGEAVSGATPPVPAPGSELAISHFDSAESGFGAISCDTCFDCGAGDSHHGEANWLTED
jgi:hypothetical protein